MWLTRMQFTVRSMMIAVACSAVALAYVGTGTTKLGCGSASVLLTFHVVDDVDGRPIDGAKIDLIRDYSLPPTATTFTGPVGSARVGCQVGCTSYSGPFFRRFRCLSYGDAVQVHAEGYQPVDELVRKYTSDLAYHSSSVPPPIVIRLKR